MIVSIVSTCTSTNGSLPTSSFVVLTCIFVYVVSTSSSTNLVYGSIFISCILNTSYFGARMFPLVPFLLSTPSSQVLRFLWLYLLLLNCSTLEVQWFLSLHFLLLSCSFGPYFNFLILAQYLCTCRVARYKIWKVLLTSFQLVPQNSFISSMLN
jgi:hypothetical protein